MRHHIEKINEESWHLDKEDLEIAKGRVKQGLAEELERRAASLGKAFYYSMLEDQQK